jgi:hypothetical protein
MSRYIPVKGYSGLVRDTETNAIINTDRSAIQRAREQKELRKMKRVEERELKNKVDSLESDVSEIKQMLAELIYRSNRNSD